MSGDIAFPCHFTCRLYRLLTARKTDAFPIDRIKRLHLREHFNPKYASRIRLADSRMPDIKGSEDFICNVLNASTCVKRAY